MEIQGLIYPIASLLGVSALTEAMVEMVKSFMPNTELSTNGKRILALVVSIIISFGLNVSIFQVDGPTYFIGILLAGLISSRGSNYIHDLAKILAGVAALKNAEK